MHLTVSILIVNYNTCKMTIDCIHSIFEQSENIDFEVIVVDNASTDGSAEAIAAEFPRLKLFPSKKNLGFAGGNNLAATAAHGDYLLLLNPDTVVLDHAVDRLVAFARQNPNAGIWGGKTVFENGELNPTSCWRFMTLWSLVTQVTGLSRLFARSDFFNPEAYGGWSRDFEREVEIVSGCFLLVDHALWERLNGFDEHFFMYAEEADLCYRAKQSGARPLFTPKATIIHYGGASEKVFSAKVVKLFTGKITFIAKHWTPLRQKIGIKLFELSVITRVVGYAVAAFLTSSTAHQHATQQWRTIWSQRVEWKKSIHPKT